MAKLVSAADLRAEIARHQIPIYRLAAKVGLHPSHLGQIIGGRRSLSQELAVRIIEALADEGVDVQTPICGEDSGDAHGA